MEKPATQRLIEAGLSLLSNSKPVTLRAVENAAEMPHGSVRHHFGGLDGLRRALVDGLIELEAPRIPDEDPTTVVRRWLDPETGTARARYQLMLLACGEPALRDAFLVGREVFVSRLVEVGVPRREAGPLLAMLDGLVLDALLRGQQAPQLEPWLRAFSTAVESG